MDAKGEQNQKSVRSTGLTSPLHVKRAREASHAEVTQSSLMKRNGTLLS